VSAAGPSGGGLHGVESDTERVLRVQTTFHVVDEAQGQAVAAALIDRAHELANSPECECDLDVSVDWIVLEDPSGGVSSGRVTATDRSSASERSTAR
jgi:hypothetical protein